VFFGNLSSPRNDCTDEGVRRSMRNHKMWIAARVTLVSLRLSFVTTYILASLVVIMTVGTEAGKTAIPTCTFLLSSSFFFASLVLPLSRIAHKWGELHNLLCTCDLLLLTMSPLNKNIHGNFTSNKRLDDCASSSSRSLYFVSVVSMSSEIFLTLGNGASFPKDKTTGTHLRPVPRSRMTGN
jgi:hypothetical protein